MAGFPAREVCDKSALVVVRRAVGDFSTVNAKVVTEGGHPSPILFPPAPSLPTAPLTPPANHSHTPPFSNGCQNIHTHSATQVFCFCLFSDMCPHVASNCFMPGCLVSLSRLGYG